MNRSLSLICVLASGMGVGIAQAAAPGAPAPATPASDPAPGAPVAITGATKIAVINFQQAVGQSNEFQRDLADLRKKYEPQETKLNAENQEIDSLKKQLQDAGTNVTDADRQTKMRSIDEKTKTLQRAAEDLRNNEQTDAQETFQQVGQKVFDVMTTYSQAQGFNLVLDASQQNSPVLWLTPGSDITKAVVDAYNTKSGVPAPVNVPSAPAPWSTPGGPKPSTRPSH
jgi:outer membrane protein